jgi:hypothetical protein
MESQNFLKYNLMKFQHHDYEIINKLKKKIDFNTEKTRFEGKSQIKSKTLKSFSQNEIYYENESNGNIVIVSSNFFNEKNDFSHEMKLFYLSKLNLEIQNNILLDQNTQNFMAREKSWNLELINNNINKDIYHKYHGCIYQNTNGNSNNMEIKNKKIYFPFKHRPNLLTSVNTSNNLGTQTENKNNQDLNIDSSNYIYDN